MTAVTLLTGGTGRLGALVLPHLLEAGTSVRVLTRQPRAAQPGVEYVPGDLVKNRGLADAVAGVDRIVHLAGGPKGDDVAMRNLLHVADRRDITAISVVAADAMPIGYFRRKAAMEQALAASGAPYTVVRAAQFHQLVSTVASRMSALPIVPAPTGLRFQPVAAEEVAARVAVLAQDAPLGRVADLIGPEVLDMRSLLRSYMERRGRHRPTVPARIPGKAGVAYRAGLNLADSGWRGTQTWTEFLAQS